MLLPIKTKRSVMKILFYQTRCNTSGNICLDFHNWRCRYSLYICKYEWNISYGIWFPKLWWSMTFDLEIVSGDKIVCTRLQFHLLQVFISSWNTRRIFLSVFWKWCQNWRPVKRSSLLGLEFRESYESNLFYISHILKIRHLAWPKQLEIQFTEMIRWYMGQFLPSW